MVPPVTGVSPPTVPGPIPRPPHPVAVSIVVFAIGGLVATVFYYLVCLRDLSQILPNRLPWFLGDGVVQSILLLLLIVGLAPALRGRPARAFPTYLWLLVHLVWLPLSTILFLRTQGGYPPAPLFPIAASAIMSLPVLLIAFFLTLAYWLGLPVLVVFTVWSTHRQGHSTTCR